MTEAANRIPTNLRTLLILEALGKSDQAMTPTEINNQIGLPKQTIHRLCTTLVNEGFLRRTADGKRLRPSARLALMGSGLLHASTSRIARHQILTDVASKVKETVNLVIPYKSGMRYVDRVETDWPFRVLLPVGTDVPFHCTASGKVFMSNMSPTARKTFVECLDLKSFTSQTLTESEALLLELSEICKRGYALDNEEFFDNMVAIAVPVHDTQNRFVAALACHGPRPRFNLETAIANRSILLDSAEKLKHALFS